jgi:hypothetical protein
VVSLTLWPLYYLAAGLDLCREGQPLSPARARFNLLRCETFFETNRLVTKTDDPIGVVQCSFIRFTPPPPFFHSKQKVPVFPRTECLQLRNIPCFNFTLTMDGNFYVGDSSSG